MYRSDVNRARLAQEADRNVIPGAVRLIERGN
jgi:hypothetical protein